MATMQEISETSEALEALQAAGLPTTEDPAPEAVAATPPEAAPPEAPVKAAEEDQGPPEPMEFRPKIPESTSKEFEELARRERAAREATEQTKLLENQIAELRGELNASKGLSQADLAAEARKNPLQFIEKFGLSYEDLTNTVLNGEKPPADLQIRNDLQNLRQELVELKKERENEATSRKEQSEADQYNKFIDDINQFVDNNSDDFELIRLQGAQQLVGDVIKESYLATNQIMPYKDACQVVEDHLEKQVRNSMRSRKFKTEAPPPEPAPQETVTPSGSTRPKTLTNQNTASPAPAGDSRSELLSRDESLEQLSKLNFWG